MMNSDKTKQVSVTAPGSDLKQEQVNAAVTRLVNLACGDLSNLIVPGDKVLLKPNLVAVPPDDNRGAITNPMVTRAVADLVLAQGARAIIGDSSAVGVSTRDVIATTGYDKLDQLGYEVVDLKTDKVANLSVPDGTVLNEMPVFQTAADADLIISLPVMKTHDQVEISLSIKNLKGILPDNMKKAFHNKYGLPQAVIDLLSVLPNTFSVVDGLYALEGMGPVYGEAVSMGMLFAGSDLVAVDSVVSQAMGVSENELIIESKANARGLGEIKRDKIKIIGDYHEYVQRCRSFSRVKDYHYNFENIDFNLYFDEHSCTGCKNTVLSSLDDIVQAKAEGDLHGKSVLAGPQQFSTAPPGEVVLIGSCLKQVANHGNYIPGCPPENLPVIEGMVGKGKVGRRYVSDSQENSQTDGGENGEWSNGCVEQNTYYQGVIFDLDNTVINSKIDFDKMMTRVIEYLQDEGLLQEELNKNEHTTSTIIEQVRSDSDMSVEQEAHVWDIISAVEAKGMEEAELEPGIVEVLSNLSKNYHLTVLTNNSYHAATTALKQFDLGSFFELVVGREQMKYLKPSPSGVDVILKAYPEITSEKWLMIGDSWIDAQAAQIAGIDFLAYKCSPKELVNRQIPKMGCIDHLLQILNYL